MSCLCREAVYACLIITTTGVLLSYYIMVITAKDGVFEQYDKAMPKSYWQRNKKLSVNLLYDPPMALERQLEDQRQSQERNRNPQYYVPTKVDKVRSEKIIAKTGASRAVAVKANVLNKIVREASGIHNYTIVAPPREIAPLTKADLENKDPETNPKMKAYAMEAKQKPTLCSFGHRPSSASRTFHPATMKFRLKHGEIAGDTKKTGFGLPVAILKQVITAPKIYLPGSAELLEEIQSWSQGGSRPGSRGAGSRSGSPKQPSMTQSDLNGLFFTPDQQNELLYNNNNNSKAGKGRRSVKLVEEEGSTSQATWISTQEKKAAAAAKKNKLKPLEPSQLTANTAAAATSAAAGGIDRPEWDSAHHRIKVAPNEVFKLRVSGLNDLAQVPLSEKLTRFAKLAVAESQFVPFCTEKQQTDKLIQSGAPYSVPAAVPLEGHPLYYDPWDVELNEVKRHRRETERRQREHREAQQYQQHLASVPVVEYYPTTRLARLRRRKEKEALKRGGRGGGGGVGGIGDGDGKRESVSAGGGEGEGVDGNNEGEDGDGGLSSPGSPSAQQQQLQKTSPVKYEPSTSLTVGHSKSTTTSTSQKQPTLLSFAYPMTLKKLESDSLELLHEPSASTHVTSHTVTAAAAPAAPVGIEEGSSHVMDYATLNRQYQYSRSLPALEKSLSMEQDFKRAMKAAKQGDTEALYAYNMTENGKPVRRRNVRSKKPRSRGKSGPNSPSQKLDDDLPVGVNNDVDKKYLAMLRAEEESFALEKSEGEAEEKD